MKQQIDERVNLYGTVLVALMNSTNLTGIEQKRIYDKVMNNLVGPRHAGLAIQFIEQQIADVKAANIEQFSKKQNETPTLPYNASKSE